MTYEVITLDGPLGGKVIQRTDPDGTIWQIPFAEANSDYQAYLAYVANGNQVPTPLNPLTSQENN